MNNVTADDFLGPVQIAVKDAAGRTVTSDNATQVTLAIGSNPTAAPLFGTPTATVSAGIATFNDLNIDVVGANYTLIATATGLTSATTAGFSITAGAARRLVFSVQPTGSIAGDALSPAVQVEIRDAWGNRVTSARDAVAVAIGNNASAGGVGALTGTKVVNAIDGIASFTGLWINKTGTGYTLAATSGTLTLAASTGFDIAAAAPAKLAFLQPPSNVQGNAVVTPSVTVRITDQFDNATSATNQVTLSLGENPWKTPFATGGTLSGTQTIAAVGGTATFSTLKIDKPAPGYTMSAASSSLSSAASSAFNVNLTFAQIATGGNHTCAIATFGSYCWGLNSSGQLGAATGSTARDSIAALVRGGLTFIAVTTGSSHSCGITTSNDAYCWGSNGLGQLGDGTSISTGPTGQPVAVTGGLKFAAIDAGSNHTCGITTASGNAAIDRQVYCWGYNFYGQLGDASNTNSPVPVRAAEPLRTTRAASLSTGGSHTCAVATNGNAYCWGNDGLGQLGDDALAANKNVPTLVSGGATWLSISAGANHTCGIISLPPDSPGRCWGYNYYGQLGDNTVLDSFGGNGVNQFVPVAIFGTLNFATLSVGDIHTCGVTSGGAGYCWGYNGNGQLGDDLLGTNTSQRSAVAGGLLFITIQSGSSHSCGRTSTAVYCWGSNSFGQGGTAGLGVNKRIPAPIVQ